MNTSENITISENLEEIIAEETSIALELAYYATDWWLSFQRNESSCMNEIERMSVDTTQLTSSFYKQKK